MATNVPDFTRYMKRSRGVYWQALLLPTISLLVGTFGIISTSCAKIVYGEYLWSPMDLAAKWDGPWGRCGAFFVGFCWVVAQIGTNLSANVISCSNDMTNLFPKYINIRRGVVITTVTAGWIMVPWKIISSAGSLLTFMSGLSIFLAPIAAILAGDYWIVKKKNIDVPGLYRRHGRYRYNSAGTNWRAAVSFLISVTPNTPGLAKAVNPDIALPVGIQHMYDMNYVWGFTSAFVLYCALSKLFPAVETLIDACIYDDADVEVYEGVEVVNEDSHTFPGPKEVLGENFLSDRKSV
jgi:NCS1 family nucleobase:cation symporter-1